MQEQKPDAPPAAIPEAPARALRRAVKMRFAHLTTLARASPPDLRPAAARRLDLPLALASAALFTLAHPLALGSFVALADAPTGLLAWVALVPLWLAVRDAPPARAFHTAWAFGFAAFLGTIYWVFIAMNTFGGIPAPVAVLLTFVLCAVLGLFPAASVGFARWLDVRGAVGAATALPFSWAAVEWGRNYVFTGFPWSNIAYTQWKLLPVAQLAEVTGLYGIVALLVAANIALAEILLARKPALAARLGATPSRDAPRLLRATAALVLAMLVWGTWRMERVSADIATLPTLDVALVQGNISQDQKHASDYASRVRAVYEAEQAKAEEHGTTLVVWPEAALPGAVHIRSQRLSDRELASHNRAWLLAGGASYWHEENVLMAQNSALLVAPGKVIAGRYHKSHLVPFGEYVPMKRLLFFARKLTRAAGNFVPGAATDIAPLSFTDDTGTVVSFGVLICYEDIFPEVARIETARGAELLVNITNDAWYGRTSAPFQHASMAVFRAIESRRSLVRAAQTGVSAFVDPTGRVQARTPIFEGPLTLHVSVPRGGPDSFYVRYGDVFAAAATGFLLVAFVRAVRLRRRP